MRCVATPAFSHFLAARSAAALLRCRVHSVRLPPYLNTAQYSPAMLDSAVIVVALQRLSRRLMVLTAVPANHSVHASAFLQCSLLT